MDDHASMPFRSEEPLDATGAAGASFDRARALAQVDGDMELLADLFSLLGSDAPAYLATIADGIAIGDRAAIRGAAHALRGAMSNFAADTACDAATAMEHASEDATREDLSLAMARLEREVARLIADIGAMLGEERGG